VLRQNGFSAEQIQAIVTDFRRAGLEPAEVAMMAFTEKVVRQAHMVTREDVEELRRHGLSDTEILDITLAAAMRCFFSKALDALGAVPDTAYDALDHDLRAALTVGRPIERR
jgi:alkylhydroperoxidase family enzyme